MDWLSGLMLPFLALSECTLGREGGREGGVTGVHVLWACVVCRRTVWLSTAPFQPLTHWYQVSWSTIVRYAFKGPFFKQCAYYKQSCNILQYIYCLLNSNSKRPMNSFCPVLSLVVAWYLSLYWFRWGVCYRSPCIFVHIGQELTGYVDDLKANERFVSSFACVCVVRMCVFVCVFVS